ncbi:MAG TPA: protein kinase [Ktedonobacterales bacterium]
MPDRVGQQLGNYRLVRMLGRGGFADVYLGEHIHLETEAAVKVLHTQLADADIAGFQREAQTIAKLTHPHIVRVLDFAVQDGVPYLAMDYAPYGTLRQQHAQGKPLSLETVVAYVKQVADALQYAHDQKIVHRDIKPENMLVDRRKELLLSDFGIAVVSQSSQYQTTQQMIGTVAYMAPEQIQGHPRPASDQYALAVVVYEWLTGARPFQGAVTEVAVQQLVVPPPPLRDKMPSVPAAVEQVVLTALAKEPKERFGSMRAFANALEQASQIKAIADFSTNFITPSQTSAPPGQATPLLSPQTPGGSPAPPTTPAASGGATPRLTESGPSNPSLPGAPEVYATNLMSPPGAQFVGPPPPAPPMITTSTEINDAPTVRSAGPAAPMRPGAPAGGAEQTMWTASSGRGAPAQGGWYTPNAELPVADYPPTWTPPAGSPPAPPPQRPPGSVSRRTVLMAGAGGLVVVAAGSTLAWYGLTHKQAVVQPTPTTRATAGPSATSTTRPTPTTPPPPRGTVIVTYRGHRDFLNSVAWSPDGRRIASGSGNNNGDYTVQVWDAVSGATAVTYSRHPSNVYSVAWSPNGRQIVSGSQDHTAQVWDASNGNYLLTYSGHSDAVYTAAWSPDGKHIASAGRDDTVQVWDASSASNSYTYTNHHSFVHSALWSKNGARIASASGDDQLDLDNSVQVWDALSGGNRVTYSGHPKPVIAVAWSPDNTRLASSGLDQTIQVWRAADGSLLLTLSGHSKGVGAVAWSPNGKYIASGSYDNTVKIWDASSGGLLYTYIGHSAGVSTVAWSADSQRVASGSFDQTVQVWQAV